MTQIFILIPNVEDDLVEDFNKLNLSFRFLMPKVNTITINDEVKKGKININTL